MSWIPAFDIGVWNAWLFMIIFPLQWGLVLVVPKHIVERTGHPEDIIQNRQDKITANLNQVFWIGATLYSIFLPLQTGTAWLCTGLAFFVIGLLLLTLATLDVARAPRDKPFTGGIYRYSRHPMYLAMVIVYLGVSIAAASWLFFLITVITFFLQLCQLLREEAYCCGRYGQAYRDYMAATARWFGLPSRQHRPE